MELSGKVISVTENIGKKTRRNHRLVQIRFIDQLRAREFPKNAAISFSGKKFENVLKLEGKEARIYFDISGQIYNGKPQNILKGTNMTCVKWRFYGRNLEDIEGFEGYYKHLVFVM